MREIIAIFLINLINDIDNVLILAAVMRKYSAYRTHVILYTAIILTFSRTVMVGVIDSLTEVPGLRVVSGLVIIFLAFRLILSKNDGLYRTSLSLGIKTWIQMTFTLLLTDFSICWDSVIVTSELSTHLLSAAIGIFLSLMTVFTLFRTLPESIADSGWIQIIAAGLISHVAILDIAKDPILESALHQLDLLLVDTSITTAINMAAIAMTIGMMLLGTLRKIKQS